MVLGLGTRLRVRMRTTLENGVPRNEQLSGSTVNNFFDQGNFEAMKTLSGWEAACCDEHQFRAKIKVSTRAILELSLFEKWSEQRMRKIALFFYRKLLRLAVFRVASEHLYGSC